LTQAPDLKVLLHSLFDSTHSGISLKDWTSRRTVPFKEGLEEPRNKQNSVDRPAHDAAAISPSHREAISYNRRYGNKEQLHFGRQSTRITAHNERAKSLPSEYTCGKDARSCSYVTYMLSFLG